MTDLAIQINMAWLRTQLVRSNQLAEEPERHISCAHYAPYTNYAKGYWRLRLAVEQYLLYAASPPPSA